MSACLSSAPIPLVQQELCRQILIVEDVAPERTRLKAILIKLGYSVYEAENGQQALQVLKQHKIGIVISDWRMPTMDGMTLLKKVQLYSASAPYFILLTGQDAVCDLIAAMDAGADDFIRKPFNSEELRARVLAGARIIRLRNQLESRNKELNQTLVRESALNRSLEQDLKAAEQLQRTLLPSDKLKINNLEFAHYFHPAAGVAGDSYNLMKLGDNHVAFYHIDVAGHGARAAMLSFALSRVLADPVAHGFTLTRADEPSGRDLPLSPAAVISELNRRFQVDDECRDYFTMVYGVLNLADGNGVLCQAGHPHPLLLPGPGALSAPSRQLGQGGLPVGVVENARYTDVAFHLAPGARLLLYSDGILACRLNNGTELDTCGLQRVLNRYAHSSCQELQQKFAPLVSNLLRGAPAEDDISLLILQRSAEQ